MDSNIVIEVFAGNTLIADKIKLYPNLFLSTVVLGELYVGVNRVVNKAKHLDKLNSFLEICSVLEIDKETARYFGEISAGQYKKGKPIPTNDIWIAASVKQHDFLLDTRDKHFAEVEGLSVENW